MITQQAQIKLNLSIPLKDHLESKARKFGLPVAAYLKHLILKDAEKMEYPVFKASDRTISKAKKALEERSKAVEITDIHEFFNKL